MIKMHSRKKLLFVARKMSSSTAALTRITKTAADVREDSRRTWETALSSRSRHGMVLCLPFLLLAGKEHCAPPMQWNAATRYILVSIIILFICCAAPSVCSTRVAVTACIITGPAHQFTLEVALFGTPRRRVHEGERGGGGVQQMSMAYRVSPILR